MKVIVSSPERVCPLALRKRFANTLPVVEYRHGEPASGDAGRSVPERTGDIS
jgi:hypothetical protein